MNEHFTFMNVPIDGHIVDFVEKMKAKGFVCMEDDIAESTIMKGEFGGNICRIFIYASSQTLNTYMVFVELATSSKFFALKAVYEQYKSLLTKKYGKGESYEYFKSPYEEGDGYEDTALECGYVRYATEYIMENGEICIQILDDENRDGGFVLLAYKDTANMRINDEEENQSIMSDL